MTILVTGAAGFIGAHLCAALSARGHRVIGCDHLRHDDPLLALRRARVAALLAPSGVHLVDADLRDAHACEALVAHGQPRVVVHLAARPGVRDSITDPLGYVGPNLVAFANLLQSCSTQRVARLLFASSSSVYGARSEAPFNEDDRCDRPESFYAATKQANEAMAHAFSRTRGLSVSALRFFTVYGPWGRPDMAYFSFAQRICRAQPITLFAGGELWRDFTYIDDVVEAVCRLAERPGGPSWEVLNVGHSRPVQVRTFLATLEAALGRRAQILDAPIQPGDVPMTCADPARLHDAVGALPCTPLETGLQRFVAWLRVWQRSQPEVLPTATAQRVLA
ncbi:MAG: NAD-dependent epimerase/dehydratase family protein [Burkholderiales bacterium]|nr:NAD-dependent epimerase/dehydratase family protein [Burkholderiales bacterium]